jgi:hypothetical protein
MAEVLLNIGVQLKLVFSPAPIKGAGHNSENAVVIPTKKTVEALRMGFSCEYESLRSSSQKRSQPKPPSAAL